MEGDGCIRLLRHCPEALVEPTFAAMQMAGDAVGIIIGRESILHPFQREATVGNSVAVATHRGPEVGVVVGQIRLDGVETERDVAAVSLPVGCGQCDERGPEITDLRNHAVSVAEGVELAGLPAWNFSEIFHVAGYSTAFGPVASGNSQRTQFGPTSLIALSSVCDFSALIMLPFPNRE